MQKYIVRLDDACPTMDRKKWNRFFDILDKYNIKPIIAVIPNNDDKNMLIDEYDKEFWGSVREWQNKKYNIALHGYNHCYISNNNGLVPINKKSEFAGVDKSIQREKIKKGWQIFKNEKINANIWVAPAHTFDKNTLNILREETTIKIISDGVSFLPYFKNNFLWIPQQLWGFAEKNSGVWTICFHPNNINDSDFVKIEKFLSKNKNKFISDIDTLYKEYRNRKMSFNDKIFFYAFFLKRYIQNLSIYKKIKGYN